MVRGNLLEYTFLISFIRVFASDNDISDMSTISDPFDKGTFAALSSSSEGKELLKRVEELSSQRKSSAAKLFQEIPFDSKSKRSMKIWDFSSSEKRFAFAKVHFSLSLLFWKFSFFDNYFSVGSPRVTSADMRHFFSERNRNSARRSVETETFQIDLRSCHIGKSSHCLCPIEILLRRSKSLKLLRSFCFRRSNSRWRDRSD